MNLTGNRCQCPACGEYFNSVAAFDKHRTGPASDRSCLDPESLGMSRNAAGFWITAAMATKPAYLAGTRREKSTIAETEGYGCGSRKLA